MKLRFKFILGFLGIALLVGAVGVIGNISNESISKSSADTMEIQKLIHSLHNSFISVLELVQTHTLEEYNREKSEFEIHRANFDRLHETYEQDIHLVDEKFDSKVKEFISLSDELVSIHKEILVSDQYFEEQYVFEKTRRKELRKDIVDLQIVEFSDLFGKLEYKSKEALFQYRDVKHIQEWRDATAELRKAMEGSKNSSIIEDLDSYAGLAIVMGKIVSTTETKRQLGLEKLDSLKDIINQLIAGGQAITGAIAYESNKVSQTSSRMFSLVTVFALIAAIGLGLFISHSVSKPLSQLRSAAEKIGKGEFTARANESSNDEIGFLGKSINIMVDDLQELQKKLVSSGKIKEAELGKEVKMKTSELKNYIGELEKARTASLNMMEDLQLANEDLKSLDVAKAEFLNMVSHELKTPLTPITANLEILDDGDFGSLSKKQSKILLAVVRNVERLREIIGNLLEISRIEAGKFVLNMEPVQLNQLAKEAFRDIEAAAKDKGLKVSMDLGRLPRIKSDKGRIEECISNYMNNALKFTLKGSIVLQTTKDKNHVKVSVTDTGVGVEKENIRNLFQKFYQTGKTEVGKAKGVGLGLYSVKKLIEMHGGKVGVESTFGKGSTFWFTLPVGGKK